MKGKPAVCVALVAGLFYSAAESKAEISTPAAPAAPAAPTFHVDDTGPHWSHVLSTDTYNRFTIGSNTRVTSSRLFNFGD